MPHQNNNNLTAYERLRQKYSQVGAETPVRETVPSAEITPPTERYGVTDIDVPDIPALPEPETKWESELLYPQPVTFPERTREEQIAALPPAERAEREAILAQRMVIPSAIAETAKEFGTGFLRGLEIMFRPFTAPVRSYWLQVLRHHPQKEALKKAWLPEVYGRDEALPTGTEALVQLTGLPDWLVSPVGMLAEDPTLPLLLAPKAVWKMGAYIEPVALKILNYAKATKIKITTETLPKIERILFKPKGMSEAKWAIERIRGGISGKPIDPKLTPKKLFKQVIPPKPPAPEIIRREDVLLRQRVRDEARGGKWGFTAGKKEAKEYLLDKFRKSSTEIREIQKEAMVYIKDNLPLEARGRYLSAFMGTITKRRAVSLFGRVERAQEALVKKDFIATIKELRFPKTDVAVDYQRKITELTRDIDFVKPTEKTLQKMAGLKQYLEKNKEILEIHPYLIKKIDRLSKVPIRDMSTDTIQEVKETIEHLTKLGKLKSEMKYKYVKRIRDERVNELVVGSRSLDPTVTKLPTGELTGWSRAKVETNKIYNDTLHTFRVTDRIDGYKGYAGSNTKIIKEFMAAETKVKVAEIDLMTETAERIKSIKINWTQTEIDDMMIHLYREQGAHTQVQALLRSKGYTEVPRLTPEMKETMNIAREVVGKRNVGEIAAVFEEIEKIPFVKVNNYFPIKYQGEFNILPSELVKHTRFQLKKPPKGFTIGREVGVEKVPRTDFFNILQEAINEQQWYIKMQPLLENTKYLVGDSRYMAKTGEEVRRFWGNYLDTVSRRGWSANATANWFLRKGRLNLTTGILGYKASSIIVQTGVIFDAMAYGQSAWGTRATGEIILEFSKGWIIPGQAKKIIARSGALRTRMAGELSVEEAVEFAKGRGVFKAIKRGALGGLKWADVRSAAGIQRGVEKILIRNGIKNAHKESEFFMNMINGSAEVTARPLILSKGEMPRLWFTFQTFFLNRWGIISHDLARGGIASGVWKKRTNALIGLGILVAGAVAEDKARAGVNSLITGKDFSRSWLYNAIMALPKQIPYFGNLIEMADSRADVDPPLIRTVENVFKGAGRVVTGERIETRVRGAGKIAEALLILLTGAPGTAQFFDIAERIFLPPRKKGKKQSAYERLKQKYRK